MQGMQIAFEFHSSFHKMCANLSPFFKRALICFGPFQKRIESSFQFSKNARGNQYIHHPIGKKENKSWESIRPIRKRNQSVDALAAFEKQIQKLFE